MNDSPGVRIDPEVSRVRALPGRFGPPLAVVSVVAAIALVVLGILFAGQSEGAPVDVGIRAYLRSLQQPWHQIALVIDWTGEPVGYTVVLAIFVLVFLRKGNRRAAVLAVAGTATAVALTTGMKPLVGRTINDGFLSYPSGHTATATAFALVATLAAGRLWLTAVVTVLAAAAMAWAQVLLNAHYPTDTFGGFCAALAIVPAVAWVVDAALDRLSARRSGGTPA
ncbi:phosphatase PAP2 family protein [Actinophytocola sp.]|uniref:phosphatase PAP2 family protein n=1 Tax=Actinophytocola sp. TaxID=1872138 RepID=UPI00389AF00C